MVKGVLDSTSTSTDFYTVFDNIVATNPQLNKTMDDVRNETNLFLVKVLRFYTHRDLAYVQELDSGKKYFCHLTHEMLSYEVSFNCMCDGNVKSGDKFGTYVEPYSTIYGVVADVRFKGTTDEKCLLSCLNYGDDNQLKSNVMNGEIRLVSGDSSLSLTRERINLMTPKLFINGLPYDEPSLKNYYTKDEISTIKSNTDAQIDNVNAQIGNINENIRGIVDIIYPVGSIYMSMNSTNPSLLFGGEWERLKDTFLLASGDVYTADSSDVSTAQRGSATVSLTQSQMPRHTHIQNPHTHIQNAHNHSVPNSRYYPAIDSSADWAYSAKGQLPTTTQSHYYPRTSSNTNGITEYNVVADKTATNKNETATNKYTGGTGSSESESNGVAHENMPPYMSVYMWKRIG